MSHKKADDAQNAQPTKIAPTDAPVKSYVVSTSVFALVVAILAWRLINSPEVKQDVERPKVKVISQAELTRHDGEQEPTIWLGTTPERLLVCACNRFSFSCAWSGV